MISKIKAIVLLLSVCIFSYCSKSTDSPKTILSVKVLQDSIPIEGAIVTIALPTGETKREFQERLTDKNGIVNFSGVENKFYYVYADKDCGHQLFKQGVDMSTVQTGSTQSFTTSIYKLGAVKIINKTPYMYLVMGYNVASGFGKRVYSGDSLIYTYTSSPKNPEIDIQRYDGPDPRPIKSYDLLAVCGDTSKITLN